MFTLEFKKIGRGDADKAGGKGASLGEMTQAGIAVPPGFVILASTFDRFIREAGLEADIDSALHKVKHKNLDSVERVAEEIQALIIGAKMPKEIAHEIKDNFKKLKMPYVAVRSSATAEDSSAAAWAGQLESYLNTTDKTLLVNVQKCWASLFTPRAIFYRFEKGLHGHHISVAVVVQAMVQSEISGIAFSVHPVTQDYNQMIIEAGFGLGEAIVSGQITPDSYVLEKNPLSIIDKAINTQERGIYRGKKDNEWKQIQPKKGANQTLSDKQIREIGKLILKIEDHYGFPVDVEWAYQRNKFYIVQSRPITTLANKAKLKTNKKKLQNIVGQEGIEEIIKKANWDVRVHRPGFLQTKALVIEGESKKIQLTAKQSIQTANGLWINGARLYDQNTVDLLYRKIFPAAFAEDKRWTEKIVERFKDLNSRKEQLVKIAQNTNWSKAKLKSKQKFFEDYRSLLQDITQYYIIAVPLTNYCESQLEKIGKELITTNAVAYLPLDIDELHASLRRLRKLQKKKIQFNKALAAHLQKYAWIKTAYNIIQPYTVSDVLGAISNEIPSSGQRSIITGKHRHFVVGLRVGIYLRNRMKEMSQQLWFASEPWLLSVAKDFDLDRESFLNVLPAELQKSFAGRRLEVSKQELKKRRQGFIFGEINKEFKILTGSVVAELFRHFTDVKTMGVKQVKGYPASPGVIRGVVRLIRNQQEFGKLNPGDILVTSMTTPDYVILMKQAGAIVTDEGGLSCHAAIVSRELKIPCVIGTKIATKVLKDGDLVEVEANTGLVKLLNVHDLKTESDKKNLDNWHKLSTREGVDLTTIREIVAIFGELVKQSTPKKGDLFFTTLKNKAFTNYIGEDYKFVGRYAYKKYFSEPQQIVRYYKYAKKLLSRTKNEANRWNKKLTKNSQPQDLYLALKDFRTGFDEICHIYSILSFIGIEVWQADCEEMLGKLIVKNGLEEKSAIIAAAVYKPWRQTAISHIPMELSRGKSVKSLVNKYQFLRGWGAIWNAPITAEWIQSLGAARQVTKSGLYSRAHIFRLLKPNRQERKFLELAPYIVFFKDWRDETRRRYVFNWSFLFDRLSEKFKITREDLGYLTFEEIEAMITTGRVDRSIIKQRKSGCLVVVGDDLQVKIFNNIPGKYANLINRTDKKEEDVVRGKVAYGGISRGRVKIILSRQDIHKVGTGDILVANTTHPDYLPAMHRAVAIVTNEGGMISHAAIVARELKKPCLVGCGNATHVFKDGDLVEVDADLGVVRPIKS